MPRVCSDKVVRRDSVMRNYPRNGSMMSRSPCTSGGTSCATFCSAEEDPPPATSTPSYGTTVPAGQCSASRSKSIVTLAFLRFRWARDVSRFSTTGCTRSHHATFCTWWSVLFVWGRSRRDQAINSSCLVSSSVVVLFCSFCE